MSLPRPLRIALPFAIVAFGLMAAVLLVKTRSKAERSQAPPRAPVVDVLEAAPGDLVATVEATGVVVPSREVAIAAEVGGRVVRVSDALVRGGRFAPGDVLFSVDARDYELAVRQEASRVQQAELELALERERGAVAARELDMLGAGSSDAPGAGALARREPHLATAERALEAARSALERAELNLSRTTVRAPFAAVVRSETVEVGQVVQPGMAVATLLGSELFWVDISVPVDRLRVLDVPGLGGADAGSAAVVTQDLGGNGGLARTGRVVGLAADLDPRTRTARVLVGVDAPLDPPEGGLPLLPGAFVEVAVSGRTLPGAIAVPRTALVDGDAVWAVGAGDALVRRAVEVGWEQADTVVVVGGLDAGDRVVTTKMSLPIEGMKVRVAGAGAEGDDA